MSTPTLSRCYNIPGLWLVNGCRCGILIGWMMPQVNRWRMERNARLILVLSHLPTTCPRAILLTQAKRWLTVSHKKQFHFPHLLVASYEWVEAFPIWSSKSIIITTSSVFLTWEYKIDIWSPSQSLYSVTCHEMDWGILISWKLSILSEVRRGILAADCGFFVCDVCLDLMASSTILSANQRVSLFHSDQWDTFIWPIVEWGEMKCVWYFWVSGWTRRENPHHGWDSGRRRKTDMRLK